MEIGRFILGIVQVEHLRVVAMKWLIVILIIIIVEIGKVQWIDVFQMVLIATNSNRSLYEPFS